MKPLLHMTLLWLIFFIALASAAHSQNESYTFIGTERGPMICVGRWVQPSDTTLPGHCEGQLMGLPQLTALSSRQTVDRLDQLLIALSSIDEKLAANNNQLSMLLQATVDTQASIDKQVTQVGQFLRETVARRFEALPAELLNSDLFREEIARLKDEILADVDAYLADHPPPEPVQ
jgi:hypothetical protein